MSRNFRLAGRYSEIAFERMAMTLGETPPGAPYPRIADGVHTMAFIEACLRSHDCGQWAELEPVPTDS